MSWLDSVVNWVEDAAGEVSDAAESAWEGTKDAWDEYWSYGDPIDPYPIQNDIEPERIALSELLMEQGQQAMQNIPSPEELVAMQRVGLAGEMSQAHQNLVSNAAQRGLMHSGILRAQQQKLTGQGLGAMQAAAAKAQAFPEQARAQILSSMAAGKPLPEVTFEQQPSGVMSNLLGLGGAIVGGFAGGGPGGAAAGYQLGSAAGQLAAGGPTYKTAGRPSSSFGEG